MYIYLYDLADFSVVYYFVIVQCSVLYSTNFDWLLKSYPLYSKFFFLWPMYVCRPFECWTFITSNFSFFQNVCFFIILRIPSLFKGFCLVQRCYIWTYWNKNWNQLKLFEFILQTPNGNSNWQYLKQDTFSNYKKNRS